MAIQKRYEEAVALLQNYPLNNLQNRQYVAFEIPSTAHKTDLVGFGILSNLGASKELLLFSSRQLCQDYIQSSLATFREVPLDSL